MEALRLQQIEGDVKTIPANKRNSYQIPEIEAHLVHVEIEDRTFDRMTGEKTSKPFVQTFYPAEFDKDVAAGHFKGKSVEILHDPRSKKAAAAAAVTAEANSDVTNALMRKPLKDMNLQELKEEYAGLYNSEPEADASEEQLRDDIADKIELIRGNVAKDQLNNAAVSEDDGRGKELGENNWAPAPNIGKETAKGKK